MPASSKIAATVRRGQVPFDNGPFVERLQGLLKEFNQSYRQAALRAGLDEQAVRRILTGQRPNITSCVLLAQHFKVDPNEFLRLAGYPELDIFKLETVSAESLPPEAVEVAIEIAKIEDAGVRRQVADAIKLLLSKHFASK
jgi:transcriptional regulator with XRE-family HTH domain